MKIKLKVEPEVIEGIVRAELKDQINMIDESNFSLEADKKYYKKLRKALKIVADYYRKPE